MKWMLGFTQAEEILLQMERLCTK